jgi:hypothetical protein
MRRVLSDRDLVVELGEHSTQRIHRLLDGPWNFVETGRTIASLPRAFPLRLGDPSQVAAHMAEDEHWVFPVVPRVSWFEQPQDALAEKARHQRRQGHGSPD